MNWADEEMSGWKRGGGESMQGMSKHESKKAMQKVMGLAKKMPKVLEMLKTQVLSMNVLCATSFAHDYSKSFADYLQHHGADETASKQRLVRRRVHQIVAPRIGVPKESSAGRLPIDFLKTAEDWYWDVFASSFTGMEIYVEWVKQR